MDEEAIREPWYISIHRQCIESRDETDSELAGYRITDIRQGTKPERRISGYRIFGTFKRDIREYSRRPKSECYCASQFVSCFFLSSFVYCAFR